MAEQLIDVDLQPSQASYKNFEKFFSKIENNEFDVKADFSGAEKEAKQFVKETEKVIENGLGDSLKAVENESKGIFANISDSVKSNFDNIISGFAGGAGFGLVQQGFELIVGSVGDAYTAANEFNTALLDIQAKTGATAQEMTVLEEAAKSAFLGGVGESLADATKTIGEAQTLLGDTFQGAELGDFTAKAQALGNLFDKDVNEVISKATPFIKQFGLSSDEAFNLLAKGLREGKTPSDDLLDTFAEYSQLAANAGFSAAQFTGVLTNGAQEGIFNLDKLADAIKETEIRLKAGDIAKGLGEIGGSNELENNLINQIKAIEAAGADGTKTVQEVLQESTDLINKALLDGNISEQLASQLQVAIAGTPAEDIGTELFGKIFSAPLDEAAINASAQKIGEEVSNAVGQYTTFDALQRQVTLLVTTIGRDVINVFNDLLNGLTKFFSPIFDLIAEIAAEFSELFGSVGEGASVIQILGDVISFLLKVALYPLKEALSFILSSFLDLVKFIKTVVNSFNEFINSSEILKSVFDTIADSIGFVGSQIRNLLESLGILDKSKPVEKLNKDLKETKDTTKNIDIQSFIKQLKQLNTGGKKDTKEFKELFEATTQSFAQVNKISTEEAEKRLKQIVFGANGAGNAAKDLAKKTKEAEKTLNDFTIDEIKNKLALLKLAGKEATEEYNKLTNRAIQLTGSQNALKKALEDVNKELDIFIKSNEIINTSGEITKKAFEDAANSIKGTKDAIKGFDLIATPIFDDIIEKSEGAGISLDGLGESVARIGGDFSEFANTIFTAFERINNITDEGRKAYEAYGEIIADVFGEAAKLAGENVELQKAFSVSQVIINTAVAISKALSQLGAFAIPATIAISALGALQVANILGAEDGVVGLTSSYNKKPGKTDTLPFLLAPGESVINSKATSINKPFLEYANKGGDLGSLFGGMASKIDITNERLINLEKAMYKAKFSKQSFNLVVENKNNSKISGAVRV